MHGLKALKVLPAHSILHKQDWFTEAIYQSTFEKEDNSFLSRSSERFLTSDLTSTINVISCLQRNLLAEKAHHLPFQVY
jgi:hypothetical protein